MKRQVRKRKKRVITGYEKRLQIAKEIFHGKPVKQVMFNYDLSHGSVRNIMAEFIIWKMVWIGPEFQEELDLKISP